MYFLFLYIFVFRYEVIIYKIIEKKFKLVRGIYMGGIYNEDFESKL